MSVILLTEYQLELLSEKGGYTGSSESRLVKMPHCWKSHVTAQFLYELVQVGMCAHRRLGMQSDQDHCWALYG